VTSNVVGSLAAESGLWLDKRGKLSAAAPTVLPPVFKPTDNRERVGPTMLPLAFAQEVTSPSRLLRYVEGLVPLPRLGRLMYEAPAVVNMEAAPACW